MAVVIQHIIRKSHLGLVWHPRQFHFIDPVFALGPAGIQQHGVNVDLPGLVLGQIQRFWHIGILFFMPACRQFLFQRLIFCDESLQIYLFGLGVLHLRRCFLFFLQQGLIIFSFLIKIGITIGQIVHENK